MEEVGLFEHGNCLPKPDAVRRDVTHATDYPGISKQTTATFKWASPTITHAFAITLKWLNA